MVGLYNLVDWLILTKNSDYHSQKKWLSTSPHNKWSEVIVLPNPGSYFIINFALSLTLDDATL
jgi:hypothetical protein